MPNVVLSRMKILFLHKQILFPRDTGGKIRVLNLLKHLARWHDVTYLSNLRRGEEKHLREMEALGLRMEVIPGETSKRGSLRFYFEVAANVWSDFPFTIIRNYDPAIRTKVAELLTAEAYDLLICDTVVMARHVMGLNTPVRILFQHNVEAQILKRHSDITQGRLKRWYMRREWRKMLRFEKACGGAFNVVVAVSEQDKMLFERDYHWNHVQAIATAVDEDYFHNTPSAEVADRVMFLGSMDWMPNQDGVKWFANEVWPAIRRDRPNATFQVVGAIDRRTCGRWATPRRDGLGKRSRRAAPFGRGQRRRRSAVGRWRHCALRFMRPWRRAARW